MVLMSENLLNHPDGEKKKEKERWEGRVKISRKIESLMGGDNLGRGRETRE